MKFLVIPYSNIWINLKFNIQLEYILNILSLSDGSKDVAALAKKLETSIDNIVPLIDLLEKKGLINIT